MFLMALASDLLCCYDLPIHASPAAGGKAGADLPRVFAELSAANLPLGLTTANCNYNRVKR